ncbi:hypothetical protein OG915_02655 [Streptomyces sp. NBC_00151]|nr:sigma factor-like helix-turn-helix DNA-binding protein [Streptomyces sp. NBC_00151]WRZ37056.1 hypothetical protein OG915_02655 [Streptomyces sp. NBC_00151]
MLVLTAWKQHTPAEAAQTMSITAGTARSRLRRARPGAPAKPLGA